MEKNTEQKQKASIADVLSDKQHKELLFYLSIAIFFLEMIIGAIAFFYGIIHAEPGENGMPPQFQFPWLVYGITAVLAPIVLLLIVHLAGVGLFRSLQKRSPEEEAKWQANLPKRLRKVYLIVSGAPTVLLFVGIILLGVILFYVDGALQMIIELSTILILPYWPWILGGLLGVFCLIFLGKVWLTYRTRSLEYEYAFRREVFERTGQVIVNKDSVYLPPVQYESQHALQGNAQALDVGTEDDNITDAIIEEGRVEESKEKPD